MENKPDYEKLVDIIADIDRILTELDAVRQRYRELIQNADTADASASDGESLKKLLKKYAKR